MKVIELFAGVGGFQLALKKASNEFEFIFSNQWEPGRSKECQYAFKALIKNFQSKNKDEIFSNEDISIAKNIIPKKFDILVGGFPCQDYSVASTNAKGIEGKKGVLWWEISSIIKNHKPKYVFLENVDRLLKSPSSQRGRDFAIMLKNLDSLGYNVEWRVINAADYGFLQKRKRVFVMATLKKIFMKNNNIKNESIIDYVIKDGVFSHEFKIELKEKSKQHFVDLNKFIDEVDITLNYNSGKFLNAGISINGHVTSFDFNPIHNIKSKNNLGTILEKNVEEKYFLSEVEIEKIKYLKGAKSITRIGPNGYTYQYKEGRMDTCDSLEKPARTMLTSESTINRSSHFIMVDEKNNKIRKITPLEAEKINGFPPNWTADVMPERMRYFCMGNALVVPLVTKIAKSLLKHIEVNNLK